MVIATLLCCRNAVVTCRKMTHFQATVLSIRVSPRRFQSRKTGLSIPLRRVAGCVTATTVHAVGNCWILLTAQIPLNCLALLLTACAQVSLIRTVVTRKTVPSHGRFTHVMKGKGKYVLIGLAIPALPHLCRNAVVQGKILNHVRTPRFKLPMVGMMVCASDMLLVIAVSAKMAKHFTIFPLVPNHKKRFQVYGKVTIAQRTVCHTVVSRTEMIPIARAQ